MASISLRPPAYASSTSIPDSAERWRLTCSATLIPTLSSERIGLPRPTTTVRTLSAHRSDDFARRVADVDTQRHLADHCVRGAGETRVIQAEGHLDAVEHPLLHDLALGDDLLRGLPDGHGHGGIIV